MATETELFDMNVWFEQLERFNQQVTQVFMSSLPERSGDQATEIYRSLLASQASCATTQLELQQEHARKQMELWLSFFGRMPGEPIKPIIEPERTDRRFHGSEWQENPLFDYLKQYYLLTARWMMDMAKAMQLNLPGLILLAMEKEKVSFRLYIDLLAMVEDKQSRQTILELAEEEARHKMRFEIEYDRLLARQQGPPT